MRRFVITCSAMTVLAVAPAPALARHHHSRHGSRAHHSRIHHHVQVRRFGSDISTSASPSAPADTAGTVQSFQNGVLTILLRDGSTTVSGTVNDSTRLECMAPAERAGVHDDGDGGSGGRSGGSDSGRGDGSGSDDRGSQTTSGQSSSEDHGGSAGSTETEANEPAETEANEPAETEANEPADTEANEPADTEAGEPGEGEHEAEVGENCSTMHLTPGTTVREAELRVSSAGSVWSKVELGS